MEQPPPHAFARSPVQDVTASITVRDQYSHVVMIPAPYPGWPSIREKIERKASEIDTFSDISGCFIRYRDRFPAWIISTLSGRRDPDRWLEQCALGPISTKLGACTLLLPVSEGMTGSVTSCQIPQGDDDWLLVFSFFSEQNLIFRSSRDVLDWFDQARAQVHILFDQIVPDEVIPMLR